MYGFESDIEIEGLVDFDLQQICIGKYDVQFRFGSGTFFTVQGSARILKDGTLISAWCEGQSWDTPAFKDILNLNAKCYFVDSERQLNIEFEEGYVLELVDNSDQYESIQIYPKGDFSQIVVV